MTSRTRLTNSQWCCVWKGGGAAPIRQLGLRGFASRPTSPPVVELLHPVGAAFDTGVPRYLEVARDVVTYRVRYPHKSRCARHGITRWQQRAAHPCSSLGLHTVSRHRFPYHLYLTFPVGPEALANIVRAQLLSSRGWISDGEYEPLVSRGLGEVIRSAHLRPLHSRPTHLPQIAWTHGLDFLNFIRTPVIPPQASRRHPALQPGLVDPKTLWPSSRHTRHLKPQQPPHQ